MLLHVSLQCLPNPGDLISRLDEGAEGFRDFWEGAVFQLHLFGLAAPV